MSKKAYSVKEAADVIGCSPRSVHMLIQGNHLPAFYLPTTEPPEPGKVDKRKKYIHVEDLDSYLREWRNTNAA